MAFETFEDEGLVVGGLLLHYFNEILVYLVVVDCPQCAQLLRFPFALTTTIFTSSCAG